MADDISSILGDGQTMEQLGSSLLQKQATDRAATQKADKKSRRVGQALAVMGVGQTIFKNAYKKRMGELDKQETFLLSNQASQLKDIQMVTRIVQNMPDQAWQDSHKDKSIDEKVKIYLEEGRGKGLNKKFEPIIDSAIKQGNNYTDERFLQFKSRQKDEYNNVRDNAMHNLLNDYFKEDENGKAKYFGFETEMRKLLDTPDSMDKIALFKKSLNLTIDELSRNERRFIQEQKDIYSNKGVIGTFKDGLSQMGLKMEEKGNTNLFKNINAITLQGGGLEDVLNDLSIKGALIGSIDMSLADSRMHTVGAENEFLSDPDAMANVDIYLDEFTEDIKEGSFNNRKYNKENKFMLAVDSEGLWKKYRRDITGSIESVWKKDIGTLVKLFADDPDFAKSAYFGSLNANGIAYTKEEVSTFDRLINDNKFRHNIAIAVTAREGFIENESWSTNKTYDAGNVIEDLEGRYGYDSETGILPELFDKGLTFSKKTNGYKATDYYNKQSKEAQRRMYSNEINKIFNSENINDREKMSQVNLLFDTLDNPVGLNFQDYMKAYPAKLQSNIYSNSALQVYADPLKSFGS
tara:strand:- start:635 stop:2368 length:1734 start_codon:yes stop_codon:yes gene_type:complete